MNVKKIFLESSDEETYVYTNPKRKCPKCSCTKIYKGDPETGLKWRGSAKCSSCDYTASSRSFNKEINESSTSKTKKVFLGGTCAKSTWREDLIELLEIDYFNPVVDDWTEECQEEEIKQRKECDYCLYVITSKMEGVYSIAEVVDDSNKSPEKCVFCVLKDGFDEGQIKSLEAVEKMVEDNDGTVCEDLESVAKYLNGVK